MKRLNAEELTSNRLMRPNPKNSIHSSMAYALVAAGVLIWFIPSDVVTLIVKQRHVLCGRYSKELFSLFFFLTPALWITAYCLFTASSPNSRKIRFAIITGISASLITLVVSDLIWRSLRKARYIEESEKVVDSWPGDRAENSIIRRRPPNLHYRISFADLPPTARSYPRAAAGFPPVELTLTTDHNGYRNTAPQNDIKIITVGDSFTEGSRVSDDQTWPVLLSQKIGKNVYNIGISGSGPINYLSAFRKYGLPLKPDIAIFMIYEGNDFKGVRNRDIGAISLDVNDRINIWIKTSPVIQIVKHAFIRSFGPINSNMPVSGAESISWIPIAVPSGPTAKYYAFHPKRLHRLIRTPSNFQDSFGWTTTRDVFLETIETCRRSKIRLIFAYAPSKPHVLMPLIENTLDANHLYEFMTRYKASLSNASPDDLKTVIYSNIDSQELVFAQFCREQKVEFISLTQPLRGNMAAGKQVYYTYDQHWTSVGNKVVAEELQQYLSTNHNNSNNK